MKHKMIKELIILVGQTLIDKSYTTNKMCSLDTSHQKEP